MNDYNPLATLLYRLSLKIEPGNSSPRLVSSKEDLGGKFFMLSCFQFTFLKNSSWKWFTPVFFFFLSYDYQSKNGGSSVIWLKHVSCT